MATELWKKPTDRSNAQQLIAWLLSQAGDSGWTLDLPNRIAFSELVCSASDPDLSRTEVMRVLGLMRDQQKTSVDEFEDLFHQDRKQRAKSRSKNVTQWKFFLPVQMTLNPDLPPRARIRILGQDFWLRPITSVRRELHKDDRRILADAARISMHTGIRVKEPSQVFISASHKADTWASAWENIAPAFDALRGMIELVLDYRRWQVHSSGKNPRRHLPHPLWMMATRSGQVVEWVHFITEEDSGRDLLRLQKGKPFDVTNQWFNLFRQDASFLKKESPPKSTVSLIADCLRLYAQAMDAHFRHQCFLGFWQLAEAVTRAQTVGGGSKKIVSRLAWHGKRLGLKGSGYEHSLKSFAKVRNDIAHRGIHRAHDEDINTLKLACEAALVWLIQERKSIPTLAHLDAFYKLCDKGLTVPQALKNSARYLGAE